MATVRDLLDLLEADDQEIDAESIRVGDRIRLMRRAVLSNEGQGRSPAERESTKTVLKVHIGNRVVLRLSGVKGPLSSNKGELRELWGGGFGKRATRYLVLGVERGGEWLGKRRNMRASCRME